MKKLNGVVYLNRNEGIAYLKISATNFDSYTRQFKKETFLGCGKERFIRKDDLDELKALIPQEYTEEEAKEEPQG